MSERAVPERAAREQAAGEKAVPEKPTPEKPTPENPAPPRRIRADAQRNVDALINAARTVFDTSGVDAPAKEIGDLAGVGVGTLYRHFPLRSDLVKAVVETGIDVCAAAGPQLSAVHEPWEALTEWLRRFTEFLGTKRGLAPALHSGDPAYAALPGYFLEKVGPALAALLDAGSAAGVVRDDVSALDLIHAIANLCVPVPGQGPEYNQRMVAILVDGLRTPYQGSAR
ncbi:TetR/AcrR family transcriptional regulator [Streptomyces sp. SID3212]|uniref:TetR/AcrR family transcriptional regulator n=1 Tax=Streptomyces sp. SID3212 TaxID=2690259 RepID=UPI00136FB78F|nr:TetR/AcrR family transcriptional regulator [Streptomyces sp. SID3212]MYV57137.1 TetR family transcriptional regulator [Streptomyces sp. SID3212]